MRITISKELREYLSSKRKKNIVVEVATSDTSDFDVSEIFLRLCDHKHREYLKEKQGYIEREIEGIDLSEMSVLFKPYRIEITGDIGFDLKKIWFFHKITYQGIKL